jgi:hypothetical protein
MEAVVHIHVIHENAAWLEPLAKALDAERLPWRDWFLDQGTFDLSRPPPEGVFYNRMSASSHTRDHRYAAELTASVWPGSPGTAAVSSTDRARSISKSARPGNTPRWKPPASALPGPCSSPAKTGSLRRYASISAAVRRS